MMGRHQYIEGD